MRLHLCMCVNACLFCPICHTLGRPKGLHESPRLWAGHMEGGDLWRSLKKHFANMVSEGYILVGNQKGSVFGAGL